MFIRIIYSVVFKIVFILATHVEIDIPHVFLIPC
jgi:hypothetical protein